MPGRKTSRFAALLLGVAMASSITAFAGEMPRETLDADHAVVSTQAAGQTGDKLKIQPRAVTNNYDLSGIPGSGEWVKLNSSAMDLSKGARLDINGTWSPSWVKMDIKLENRQNGTYSVWYNCSSGGNYDLHSYVASNYDLYVRTDDATINGGSMNVKIS